MMTCRLPLYAVVLLISSVAATPSRCPDYQVPCPGFDYCSPNWILCDGEVLCHDPSKEPPETCTNYACPDHMAKCGSQNKCVYGHQLCDGNIDCEDGWDNRPENCNATKTCFGWFEFTCRNGRCVYEDIDRCDGDDDCGDNSDEENCLNYTCPKGKVKQPGTGICVANYYFCDGVNFLPDGWDERPELCNENFQCLHYKVMCGRSGICTRKSKLCDGKNDCSDGWDERPELCNATSPCMPEYQVKCGDSDQCIWDYQKCNRIKHCDNDWDELPETCGDAK